MNFAELVAEVVTKTNRPDLTATDITSAVRAATLKFHQMDFFARDIAETGIQWSPSDYLQSLDYKSLWPRYRALKYLRKYDNTTTPGTPGKFFTVVLPEKVVDGYAVDRVDICYLAGAELQIKSSTIDDFMLIGFYQYPDTNPGTFDSWIARDHPWAIIFEAAAKIWASTGFQEQAAQALRDVQTEMALVTISGLTPQGY